MTTTQDSMNLNSQMVDDLVRGGMLLSPKVEAAFRAVPRHLFLPGAALGDVYSGRAVVTAHDAGGTAISSSSEPAIMARMLEQLDLQAGERVLEIGAGTGYNAALIGHLIGPTGSVATMDLETAITDAAQANLAAAGVHNARVITGDGWVGPPGADRFDRIIVTVGVSDLSPAWVEELAPSGVLVVPLWLRAGLQVSVAFRKTGPTLGSLTVTPCGFMRLRGESAGPERYAHIGAWSVSVDEADDQWVTLLDRLLRITPDTWPMEDLDPNWFVRVALSVPGALTMTRTRLGEWISWAGIFDHLTASLCVVETQGWAVGGHPKCMHTFGGQTARDWVSGVIDNAPPIALDELAIEAHPSRPPAADAEALAVLPRRHFTFVVTPRDHR